MDRIQVAAFRWLPEFTHGYVKDLRVRWALEEAGMEYSETLIDHESKDAPEYRQWQPFGQVPAYRDDHVTMFESGAIVLHIAAQTRALAPADVGGFARISSWVFAALNTVEPVVKAYQAVQNDQVGQSERDRDRKSAAEVALDARLSDLAAWLGAKPFLEDEFSAGDLMMTTVLRELDGTPVLQRFPSIDRLRGRCEDRPAFKLALAAQLSTFRANAPSR